MQLPLEGWVWVDLGAAKRNLPQGVLQALTLLVHDVGNGDRSRPGDALAAVDQDLVLLRPLELGSTKEDRPVLCGISGVAGVGIIVFGKKLGVLSMESEVSRLQKMDLMRDIKM